MAGKIQTLAIELLEKAGSLKQSRKKSIVGRREDGGRWMDGGWMRGSKSRLKNCLQQSICNQSNL